MTGLIFEPVAGSKENLTTAPRYVKLPFAKREIRQVGGWTLINRRSDASLRRKILEERLHVIVGSYDWGAGDRWWG